MKSLIVVPAILLSSTVMAVEPLNEGAYLSIGVGASRTQNWKASRGGADAGFKTGVNARAAVGHRFCGFRVEFEPSYIDLHKKADDNSLGVTGHMRTLSTLGNVYYQLPTFSGAEPYIGVGAGFSSVKTLNREVTDGPKINRSSTKFAYQGIVGASFVLNEDTSLNIDYRYFQTEKLNHINRGVRNHSINLGLSYFF